MIEHLLNFNLYFGWFVIPAYLVQPLTLLIMIGTAWLGQTVVNRFVESPTDRAIRKALNEEQDTTIKKPQKKDPNKKVAFPIPLPNPKSDDNPDKKNNQDPVADKKPDGKPDPNNDDAPKINFKRILPPNNKPPVQQTGFRTPPPTPINVVNPPYFKRTGKFIYQPLEQYIVNFYSMPNVLGDSDFTEVVTAQSQSSKNTEYSEYLRDSRLSNETGKYNISDLMSAVMAPGGIIDANPTLIIGSEAIGKMTEAYENYSDGFLSNPIWFVPTEIKVHIIKGIGNKKRRLPPELDTNFKVINPIIPEVLLEQQLFKIPKEVTMERVLEFAGHCATYEGGYEKWEEWKKNPSIINDPLFFEKWKIPTNDDILNRTVDPSAPQYQKQKLKIDSLNEQLLVMAGTLYVKAGLHEFPAKVPSLTDPPYVLDAEDKRKYDKPADIQLPNLASGMAYGTAKIDKSIGQFPLEIETETPEGSSSHAYMPNMANSMSQLTALTMATAAISQFNMNTNLKNTRTLTETRSAAVKAMNCSCANLDFSGANTNPVKRCLNNQWNMRNAKGFNDMANPKAQQCDIGLENKDSTSIKKYLTDILFGVNIIKGAFFKGSKELDQQIESIKDINKDIKAKDKKFDDFVEEFNKGRNELTKPETYPTQPKIIIEPKQPNPPN